jgi:hypothetical protein
MFLTSSSIFHQTYLLLFFSCKVCGRCRGRLEYAGPAATPGSNNSEGSGGLRQKQKRAPGAFALFVQTNYAATKLALQRNKRELVYVHTLPLF